MGTMFQARNVLSQTVKAVSQARGALFQTAGTMFQMQNAPLQTAGTVFQPSTALLQTARSRPEAWGVPPAGRTAPWVRGVLSRTGAGTPRPPAGQAPEQGERRPALPGLAHFARPLEPVEDTLPDTTSGGAGEPAPGTGGPAMIFRSPAPAAAQTALVQEQEGEAVLSAQAIAPEQARAMNRAFSYAAPAGAGTGAEAEPGALVEQRVQQTAGPGVQEVNYNRLTEEILVRIERRLRAERRKFGL